MSSIDENRLSVSEVVGVRATNPEVMQTFKPDNPFFSCFNLDTREIISAFADIRTATDITVGNLKDAFKYELFDHYDDSFYRQYFESKKTKDSAFNGIIDEFTGITTLSSQSIIH